jgi:hypothetical protein
LTGTSTKTGPADANGTNTAKSFRAEILPILANGLPAGKSWPIRAEVRSAFQTAPAFIDFGREIIRGTKLPAEKLEVECLQEFHDLKAVGKTASIEVRVDGKSGSTRARLTVRPAADQPSGPIDSFVSLSAVVPGQGIVTKEVPVYGRILDEIYCVPDCLTYGALAIGQAAEDVVLLRSRSGYTFEVVQIESDHSAGITITRVASPSGPLQFHISQRCLGNGLQHSQVRFVVRRAGLTESEPVNLKVVYHGVPKA